jgi:hypothetical protein
LTSTSNWQFGDAAVEGCRLRLERILQIVSQDFNLRFEFGNRDLVGESQIVLKATAPEAVSAHPYILKARVLNLLGHYQMDSRPWYEAALREEAQQKPGFASFWHALEDARIENRLVRQWAGTRKYFQANMLPNFGGKLLRRMRYADQLEQGLYFEGRGHNQPRYAHPVRRILNLVGEEIQQGSRSDSARDSFAAMQVIYPHFAALLRSDTPRQSRRSLSHQPQKKGDTDQAGEPLPAPPRGSIPEIDQSDDLVSVGLQGKPREFPEWFLPGSAPWFERGIGKKEIHPSALRTNRQTIVPPPKGDIDRYRTAHNEIHHEAGYLAQRLLNLIREEVYLRYAGYFRTGRLNKAKLWKQRIGNYRLFQQQVPGSSHAVAFSLLVDESASMKGQDKYKIAMKAALLLGETLDFVGVPLEIIGYTTEDYEARAAMKLGLTPAHAYRATRCSALEHRIYKRFDEPYYAVRARLTGMEPRHNNWDEEHLIFAFQRIQERPERRKVMIIISDGQPNGDANYLVETVKKIESTGCRLIGIGIGADFVKEIYPAAVVVNDFVQMGEELIHLLAQEFRASTV